ncbi:MAG: lipoyl domain-containing protein [Planctomycetia bacterium]
MAPDLGIDGTVTVSLWLVPVGASVLEGDRIVELLAGAATIDLEAPVAGTLVTQHIEEDDVVQPGAVLADIEPVEGA